MTYRPSDSSSKDCYSESESRLNQLTSTDGSCPVIEESGTVCGETNSLSIFQEFRQLYDDYIKQLEQSHAGSATLKKLDPIRKLIENLWEQNTMLVETVEELEQEATCRVTNLQDRLNKSCQKMTEYKEDVMSLIEIIHRFSERGILDFTGLKFHTLCPSSIYEAFIKSCPETTFFEETEGVMMEKSPGNGSYDLFSGNCYKTNEEKPSECDPCKVYSTLKASFENTDKQPKYQLEKKKNLRSGEQSTALCMPCNFSEVLNSTSCNELVSNENCLGFSNIRSDHNSGEVICESCNNHKCQCARGIKINFNIEANSVIAGQSCHCDCPCSLNSCENND